jgi:hypothetical protein
MMQYPLLAAVPPPVVVFIEFLFEYDATSSLGSLPPPVVVSY